MSLWHVATNWHNRYKLKKESIIDQSMNIWFNSELLIVSNFSSQNLVFVTSQISYLMLQVTQWSVIIRKKNEIFKTHYNDKNIIKIIIIYLSFTIAAWYFKYFKWFSSHFRLHLSDFSTSPWPWFIYLSRQHF